MRRKNTLNVVLCLSMRYLNRAGVHVIPQGGYLKVHTDFPFHSALRLWRRVNVLLYLNVDWESAWSGDLQLWDANLTRCQKYISPIFNRMVRQSRYMIKLRKKSII